MRRLGVMVAVAVASVALAVGFASSAGAYGGGASHDMWQIGFSFNCNNPAPGACDFQGGTGGNWGWLEFDRSADGTQTWGDAKIAFCFHTPGGGGAGAGNGTIDITSWTIAPGSAGPQTFFASGIETDNFRGQTETTIHTNEDTGFSAVPGHYSTSEILGFSAPGIVFEVQVAFRPAK
jgi:hypothetical protein